jgi:hypothetical protein
MANLDSQGNACACREAVPVEQGDPMKPGMIGSGIAAGFVAAVVPSAMMLIRP